MSRPKVLVLNPPLKLREVAKQLSKQARLVRGYYRDIEIVFSRDDMRILIKGKDLRKYDYVWVTGSWSKRDFARAISLYLTHHQRPHTVVSEGGGTSKLVDMTHFALNKLPQPRSYFCSNTEYARRVQEIATVCKFPLIAKDVKGTFGRKSFLANSLQELREHLFAADENTSYVFQEFIPNCYDWGIVVGNGSILSAEKSYRNPSSDCFMNHAASGAQEVFVPLIDIPQDVINMAIKASEVLNLTWARSDIVINSETDAPFILETNRSPRMTPNSTEVTAFTEYIKSFLSQKD